MKPQDERFCLIYESMMPLMRKLAKKWGTPFEEIDDVVQETYVSYFSHYPLTWPEERIKKTLVRILKNLCIDHLRKKSMHPLAHMEPDFMRTKAINVDFLLGKDTLSVLIQKEEYQRVMEALRSMREDWAAVFLLYIIQERPMSEVSRVLGISEAACRMRLMRGRKYLKDMLNEESQEEPPIEACGEKSAPTKTKWIRPQIAGLKKPPETSTGVEVPGSA